MSRIRIHTEHVRTASQQFVAHGEHLAALSQELQGILCGIDSMAWHGVSRSRAEPMMAQAQPQGLRLGEELGLLGRTLQRVAEVFEQQDSAAARNLAGMPWVEWDSSGGGQRVVHSASGPGGNPSFDRLPGTDGAAYGRLEGSLFVQGLAEGSDIDPSDVSQGLARDCSFLASLAAVAQQNPEALRRSIRANEDGTYTVTLYERNGPFSAQYEPVEVTVTPDFPMRDNVPILAAPGDTVDGRPEMWTMLWEKAYAQHVGGYDAIPSPLQQPPLEVLTGVAGARSSPAAMSIDDLANYQAQGYAVTAATPSDIRFLGIDIPDRTDTNPLFVNDNDLFTNDELYLNHEYYITDVDPAAGTVTVRNPWGWNHGATTLSFAEFQTSFFRVSVNPTE